MSDQPSPSIADRIWIGPSYAQSRTLVLGESYFGSYEGEMETDEVYFREYVAGRIDDKLFGKIDQAIGLSRAEFWNAVAFTNLVTGSIGPTSASTAKEVQFHAGMPRLRMILDRLQPERVWILGKSQSKFSGRVCDEKGVPWEAIAHPTGKNNMSMPVTEAMIRASWQKVSALGRSHRNESSGSSVVSRPQPAIENRKPLARASISRRTDMVFPPINSRDQDPHQRRWRALGFGGKKANETTWRYWSEAGGQGPWRIAAPHGMAEYQLVDKKLYLDGEHVLTGRTQWDATWRALAHFYVEVVPKLDPPPLAPKGG